ncbi:hypothetical protein [Methylocella sp.]|uniref:hypothetical protein n=1 Tax=Methylocella sp. TaxID=1978226 RepID=UPI0037838AA6
MPAAVMLGNFRHFFYVIIITFVFYTSILPAANAQFSWSNILSAVSNGDIGKQLKEVFDAVRFGGNLIINVADTVVCLKDKGQLSKIQSNINLLASNKLSLAETADRYVSNDTTLETDIFIAQIKDVTDATQNLFSALYEANYLFTSSELSAPYRQIVINLRNKKNGILPRMEMAVHVAELHEGDKEAALAKSTILLEINKLRSEAINLGATSDKISLIITKLDCHIKNP